MNADIIVGLLIIIAVFGKTLIISYYVYEIGKQDKRYEGKDTIKYKLKLKSENGIIKIYQKGKPQFNDELDLISWLKEEYLSFNYNQSTIKNANLRAWTGEELTLLAEARGLLFCPFCGTKKENQNQICRYCGFENE